MPEWPRRINEEMRQHLDDEYHSLRAQGVGHEDAMRRLAGDVDEVLRRLLMLVEETGPFGTLVLMSYDWDDKNAWLRSMELFAKELMPALNKAVCGQRNR